MSHPLSPLREQFLQYIQSFNRTDEELFIQKIPNREAAAFLEGQIPMIECPSKEIEKTYYFRWWTYRKQIKDTPKGHIITEFLPDVPWAGPYNSIVCPAALHIREGRWLRDPEDWLLEYIDFWLNGNGKLFAYSNWLAHALWEYCCWKDDFSIGIQRLPKLIAIFEEWEQRQKRSCGLYWSHDGRDGGEFSISGSGLRPTLNSYAWADATAIARLAEKAGDTRLQAAYQEKADQIRDAMDRLLWDGDFYKTLPAEETWNEPITARPAVDPARDARELLGYIPWYFDLPGEKKTVAFRHLMDSRGFYAPYGLTTAEQQHPRFMEEFSHECLWNGPVWPFATSQTLVAVANLLRHYNQDIVTKQDYYTLLLQYAQSHRRMLPDGTEVPWIDENMHPYTGSWLARDILEQMGWQAHKGGYERGKDYNHSLFCDLVLSGLFGIDVQDGLLTVQPLIPEDWEYFRVENLYFHGKPHRILYDKTGTHYNRGTGILIEQMA